MVVSTLQWGPVRETGDTTPTFNADPSVLLLQWGPVRETGDTSDTDDDTYYAEMLQWGPVRETGDTAAIFPAVAGRGGASMGAG